LRPERAASGERPTGRRLAWVLLFAGVALVLASGTVVFVLMNGGHGAPRATMVEPPVPAPSPGSSQPSASPSASASASPSPSASKKPSNGPQVRSNTACPLPKHPDASCTGVPAGVALSVKNGNMDIKTPNTVIDGKDIRGCVRVYAPGVVIRRSKISCSDFIVVASFRTDYSGTGLRIEDSEISCGGGPGTGVSDSNVTALRLNVHGCENGFSLDSSVSVSDTYVHDLYTGGGGHPDAVEMEGGSGITVAHNTLFAGVGGNSAIITDPTKMSNVTISDNLMAGGAYTLYCPRDSSSNVRVINNRVSRMFYPKGGEYGPWTDCGKVAQLSGNTWDTGQALSP
jgi:hypothetical protein